MQGGERNGPLFEQWHWPTVIQTHGPDVPAFRVAHKALLHWQSADPEMSLYKLGNQFQPIMTCEIETPSFPVFFWPSVVAKSRMPARVKFSMRSGGIGSPPARKSHALCLH